MVVFHDNMCDEVETGTKASDENVEWNESSQSSDGILLNCTSTLKHQNNSRNESIF